jgi:predicted NUDIX family NTP pyrophosphohydrolase
MGGKSAGEPKWRAARRCDTGACVEIGTLGPSVLVRSSTDPGGKYVTISPGEWQEFIARVKDGDFDGL